ncbi:adenylate/guanylate cyclase domain-containing protein [Oceaniglobus trochenteri]|uniref:adenylate/guanylate cyclase domain-containing protein n=1 Tax=Oceaniglobus trochenteri TaxID=2763260 RepID=UPI001CFFE78F|nr:adenylate/guanylate cyclase domain-containing protein [Oceaniglobus trochenteri]
MSLACVLVSDVTGSTRLFDRMGNAEALARIDSVLARMRALIVEAGGHCVKSKGDDVLSFFPDSNGAFLAAWAMINEPWPDDLAIHAGAYFGEILSHANDIYGGAVNTAARLASLAKAGEILFGDACHDDLDESHRQRFLAIGAIPLRGKEAATQVFSCTVATLGTQTTVIPGGRGGSNRMAIADVSLGDAHWQLVPGGRLTIGRAPDSDILIKVPSVSRSHAVLTISSGELEFTDHSSGGSRVRMDQGQDLMVHRRTTLLSGAGEIVIGTAVRPEKDNVIGFRTGALERV